MTPSDKLKAAHEAITEAVKLAWILGDDPHDPMKATLSDEADKAAHAAIDALVEPIPEPYVDNAARSVVLTQEHMMALDEALRKDKERERAEYQYLEKENARLRQLLGLVEDGEVEEVALELRTLILAYGETCFGAGINENNQQPPDPHGDLRLSVQRLVSLARRGRGHVYQCNCLLANHFGGPFTDPRCAPLSNLWRSHENSRISLS